MFYISDRLLVVHVIVLVILVDMGKMTLKLWLFLFNLWILKIALRLDLSKLRTLIDTVLLWDILWLNIYILRHLFNQFNSLPSSKRQHFISVALSTDLALSTPTHNCRLKLYNFRNSFRTRSLRKMSNCVPILKLFLALESRIRVTSIGFII
jgi:hypothetical protein